MNDSSENPCKLHRRDLIKGATAAGLVLATGTSAMSSGEGCVPTDGAKDLIRDENAKPGTRDWMLTKTRIDPKTRWRSPMATIYDGPRGNVVFNGATIWWAQGLSPPGHVLPSAHGASPKGSDARVQRITANLLNRIETDSPLPANPR